PTFAEIVATKSYPYTHPDGSKQVFVNKNKMLSAYPGADGVKTGYTTVAGRCLVSSATREGMRLIAVVLNVHDMWRVSAGLLDKAFATYRDVVLWQADEVKLVPYREGKMPAKVRTTLRYPLSDEEVGRLVYEYHLDGAHRDPNAPLGEVLVRLDDAVVARASLYSAD
ncbi:MAG: D-alanyl-D-alanine carboxypeptidase, partial [Clostridia bacterium]|nr:D-alanyl-D-alanine carboxypeptidase [Clostridia bacterium]